MRLLRGLAFAAAVMASSTASAQTLRVFAAASLSDAFRDVAAAFEAVHPGVVVELNLAGSQLLRTQIEQGALADVFAAAEPAHAEALRAALLLEPPAVFATNRLVVVVPRGASRVERLADLARPGVKLVVAGSSVPAGRYSAQVLDRLEAAGVYGAGFAARARANVVSEETNVRIVLAKVALGEADAGLVYATDAATSDRVRAIEVPAVHNVVAEYPIGVVTRSGAAGLARAFVDMVLAEPGREVLRRHGFGR